MTASPARPRVIYATIYPPKPDRGETFVTRELLREYTAGERAFDLSVVIASAHRASLEVAAKVLREFPAISGKLIFLETEHAGVRAEEISFCKAKLPELLAGEAFDWLLFMDADVWTPIAQVPEWMELVGEERARRFVKVKYCLRNDLSSPHHTLGAFFHHKALLEQMQYWTAVFPQGANGKRLGAPDCYLHDYLEGNGCRKIVPERLTTFHFLNAEDAHVYRNGELFPMKNARQSLESGEAVRKALEPLVASVSAMMVTGKCEQREWLARGAVRCFEMQTHPEKELIIVNQGGRALGSEHPDVREILVPPGCRTTLGDLRNIGLAAASGDWVMLWDDDDWHAPERMAVQVAHARKDAVVLLQSQIRYDFTSHTAFVYRTERGIDGTLMHPRDVPFKYPSDRRGEDSKFLRNFGHRTPIANDAGLFVRLFHGANTWNVEHIMKEWAGRAGELHLSDAHKALLLEQVLPHYGKPSGN
jgi:hypothetical protein